MDIRLENLAIGYSSRHAVGAAIDVTIGGGRLTCVIGANGTGKSTLLKTIAGFIPPLRGSVHVGDRDVNSMSRSDMARTVAVVLATVPAASAMSVREIVALGRTPYTGFWGKLSDSYWRIVDDAMVAVGITQLARRKAMEVSDGERQKTMIARALAQQTPVLLLDEPTAFLDYPSKAGLMKALLRLAHAEGKTIVLSTHDLELAVRLADDLLLMDDATLRPVGREDVAQHIAKYLNS